MRRRRAPLFVRRAAIAALAPVAGLGGCVPFSALEAVVSPTCLTTPRVELEIRHELALDLPKGGGLSARSTTAAKLKRRCVSNPKTYEEGVAKVLGGVGTAIGAAGRPVEPE